MYHKKTKLQEKFSTIDKKVDRKHIDLLTLSAYLSCEMERPSICCLAEKITKGKLIPENYSLVKSFWMRANKSPAVRRNPIIAVGFSQRYEAQQPLGL